MTAILFLIGIPSVVLIYQFIALITGAVPLIAISGNFVWTTVIRECVISWALVFGLIGIGVCIVSFLLWQFDKLDDDSAPVPMWMMVIYVILGVLSII